ncbi:MAG: PD40 domain-containing protein [Proteobacteria bacterium]|nr:PD40 domain-containing protein [Pseudomonadota bacterium]
MKPPTFLDLGRRKQFGRPVRKPLGPLPPPPDPAGVPDFELATWRVRPSLARMTRADRILALDAQTLAVLLILAERPPGGVNRDELMARVLGPGEDQDKRDKLRRSLSFLRRAFSEDGSVRIVNAPGDSFVLEVGPPQADRGLRPAGPDVLLDNPPAIGNWLRRGKRRGLAIGVATVVVFGITIALVWISNRGQVVLSGRVAAVAPFATEPGAKRSPSFSPDGRQLVYSWRQPDGTQKLYLRALPAGAPRPLTTGGGDDAYPAWSPKGDLIAFQRRSETTCAVLAIPPAGGEMRLLGDCDFGGGGPMTWTRDGAALIYTHRTAWNLATQIVSVSVADLRMIGVTNPTVGMPGDSQPTLATTGRRLAIERTRAPGAADLMLLELGGVAPERLTRDGVPTAGMVWEPGGFRLIVASPRGGRDALWRSRVNGSAPELLLAGPDPLRAPALTGDGRTLAFERWHLVTRLARLPLAGADEAPPWREGGAFERGLRFSPDGRQAVFVSNRGGREALWLAPTAGGEPTALTQGHYDYLETPRWSPDGRFVAFTAAIDQRLDVWVVDVGTREERRATDDGASRAPSFSRDGRFLYVGSARGRGWQIWRRPWPAEGSAVQVTTEGGLAALESASGSVLYYVRADRRGLWQRDREPGGDEVLISPEVSPIDYRNWDVVGEAIWFPVRPVEGVPLLARFSLLDARLTRFGPLPDLLPDSGLTLAPDGRAAIAAAALPAEVDLELATLE